MTVRDEWLTVAGDRTARYGRGLRWRATWTDASGERHSKSFGDRDEAARHAAEMDAGTEAQRALAAALARGFGVLEFTRQAAADLGTCDPGALAAELRRRIPPGQEEHVLKAVMEALAATAAVLPNRRPGTHAGGRPRTAAQAAKDARAVALHKQGLTYPQIAEAIGLRTKAGAYTAVQRGLAEQARQQSTASGEVPAPGLPSGPVAA